MDAYIQDFDFHVNLLRCVLWQYNDAERLQSLLQSKQDWYGRNQEEFWGWWIKNVFDLRTANDFGLSVWGKILLESRDAYVPGMGIDYPAWGFGQYRRNFGRGNFRRAEAGYIKLGVEQYRMLLRLRYYKLVSRGTVPEINAYLKRLFADEGRVYVLDPLDMSFAVYVFTYAPSSWQRFVLEDMDALPRPAGVGAKIRVVHRGTFGFGPHHLNFSGNFAETRM
ncbi:DUF2612 domain-containing protein [Desulfovibrio sp. OttesenSCG-928-C14]|nr:DUF2612 domain-containing protein [Desulfovibrio sp. OttesenSCG-928-C14]